MDPQRSEREEPAVMRQYWEERSTSAAADDVRTVTLAPVPGFLARIEVSLYQGWSFRAIDALSPGRSLAVDLACGLGTWTVRLAERVAKVVAVDGASGFVRATHALAAARGVGTRVTVTQDDLRSYAVPAGADIILLGAVTQYLDEASIRSLLARARAALAPGGVLYLRTTVSRTDETVTRRDPTYQADYRPIAWYRDLLAAAGWHVRTQETATRFVPAEIGRRWHVGWLFAPLWRLLRSRRKTDVCAFLATAA